MPIHNPPSFILDIPKKHGRSLGKTAKDGVTVIFNEEFPSIPYISLCPWQKALVWLTEVTLIGFTWKSDKKKATIDWIAVGNGSQPI